MLTGLVHGSEITQTPFLWKEKGDRATMDCSHTKGAAYFQMYWYRQLPGKTMEQVVFTTTVREDHDFGKFSKEKFSATKPNAENGTLTVTNLDAADKGLYFCAVSKHSDTGDLLSSPRTSAGAKGGNTVESLRHTLAFYSFN